MDKKATKGRDINNTFTDFRGEYKKVHWEDNRKKKQKTWIHTKTFKIYLLQMYMCK